MEVRFKKLHPDAVIPTKAHPTDAGADLTAVSYEINEDTKVITYHTGIAVEIPEGYVGLIFPRSSVYKTGMVLSNCVGVIDSHYRGEILAKFYGVTDTVEGWYFEGFRIAQLVIMPYPEVQYVEADELSETDRGTHGYGSTGK